jgi:hypothetical protein
MGNCSICLLLNGAHSVLEKLRVVLPVWLDV